MRQGEVAERLRAIYQFCNLHLAAATMEGDPAQDRRRHPPARPTCARPGSRSPPLRPPLPPPPRSHACPAVAPYLAVLSLTRCERDLIAAGDWEGVATLGAERAQVVATLPAEAPAEARPIGRTRRSRSCR